MRQTLQQLSEAWGPPGHEGVVRDLLQEALGPQYADQLRTDPLGNLHVGVQDEPVRLLVVAHMDEAGLFVTDIDERGFLRFAPAGPLQPAAVLGQFVHFADGQGAVVARAGGEQDKLELSRLYLDVGARTREEAAAHVPVGSFAALGAKARSLGDRFVGKALHNRAGCAVLLATLKQLGQLPPGVVFVFAVQGKLDERGAKVAAQSLQPQRAIVVDTMPAGDTPQAPVQGLELGRGAVIKVRDQTVISHPELRTTLQQLAERNGIPYQLGVQVTGGSAGGPVHLAGTGVPTGLISVPLRNEGTAVEMVDVADVQAAVRLLAAAVAELCA